MLETLPVLLIIIISLAYARWRNAYLTQVMVIANFVIFALVFLSVQIDYDFGSRLIENNAFQPSSFGSIQSFLTIFTSMFLHYDPIHCIGNILILYLIGLPLEERIGSKNWGVIYFSTGFIATLLFYMFHPTSDSLLLGASGAIYGIAGALLILYPRDRIPMLIGPIFSTRAPVWAAVGIMLVMTTFLVMLSTNDGVAHLAHFGGIASGILIAHWVVGSKEPDEEKMDYELLRKMVVRKEDNEVVDKIEKETEPEVQQAWLEFFFQHGARCPKCKRPLKEYRPKITCECGETWKVK